MPRLPRIQIEWKKHAEALKSHGIVVLRTQLWKDFAAYTKAIEVCPLRVFVCREQRREAARRKKKSSNIMRIRSRNCGPSRGGTLSCWKW